jgi:hypothetical protein
MKTYVKLFLIVFASGLAGCLNGSINPGTGQPRPVKIDEHSILIPGTTITAKDQEEVKEILKNYRGSLYRIEHYEKGVRKERIGRMSAMEMDYGYVADFASFAKSSGLTTWTTKIGMGCNPTRICPKSPAPTATATPTPTPDSGQRGEGKTCNTTCIPKESDALVKEVTPILEKYGR